MRGRLLGSLCLVSVFLTAAPTVESIAAQPGAVRASLPRADAQGSTTTATVGAPRAPSRAPLVTPGAPSGGSEAAQSPEAEVGSPQGQADPLVSNGLGSPSCQSATAPELSVADRAHCESSGFVASAAPTGDYGIDVHIDTGILGVSSLLSSAVQDLVITPIWMGLVWAVHALVVMLEWCFTIDLLPGASAGGLGGGLRRMEQTFTRPWLALALAVASVLALYHGLIRRRVAETVGEALVMVAMMLGGLWVISDPVGTLGALGGWANQAALGTLAVAAQGSPEQPERTFTGSLDTVFASAIEGPWCYLEFGDVAWCREPGRLDPGLRSAGLKIASDELGQVGCSTGALSAGTCVATASWSARTLEHSAQMLRAAHSNGAIVLALPPNGPARNSINTQGSLLRTMCQSAEATNCRGPDAAPAQFRTAAETWSRLGGLLLIAAGSLGLLLLLGFLALRLLAAALFSLLYLLLAPAMVLAPAFGDGGRALFRKWAQQLLGTVVAKLLFSFLLGVVFALVSVIASLNALGWWTQWLLMSTLWWGAYVRRHEALGVVGGALGREPSQRSPITRRLSETLEARRRSAVDRWVAGRHRNRPAPDPPPRRPPARPSHAGAPGEPPTPSGAPERGAGRRGPESRGRAEPGAGTPRVALLRAQLERVRLAQARAQVAGNARREAELRTRGLRIAEEIAREPPAAPRAHEAGHPARDAIPPPHGADGAQGIATVRRGASGGASLAEHNRTRDYGALSEVAGYSRSEYQRLEPRAQREARRVIDRELAARRDIAGAREPREGVQQGAEGPARRAAVPDPHPDPQQPPSERDAIPRRPGAQESSVMHDVREVQAGRKRQLGLGRP